MWFADRVFRAEIMIAPNSWNAEQIYLLVGRVALLSVCAFATSVRKHKVVDNPPYAEEVT